MKIIKTVVLGASLLLSSLAWAGQVDINTADAVTLATELKGIGEKKAQAIVDYRKQYGPFKNVDDLANVKGISTKTIDNNRANIVLKTN
ncbi:MAG TPA: ComEA family DNA-binding protein [Gammaproteobacteria bacterium]